MRSIALTIVLLAGCQPPPPGVRMISLAETLRLDCDLTTPPNGYNDETCLRAKHEHAEQVRAERQHALEHAERIEMNQQRAAAPAQLSGTPTDAPTEYLSPRGTASRRCYAIPGDKLGACYPYITLPGGYRQLIVPGRPRDYPLPLLLP